MIKPLRPDKVGYDKDEMIGRYIETPFGIKEIVVIKKIWWDYYDWLAEQGLENAALIKNCHKKKPHLSLSEALTWQLWHVAWHRQTSGIKQPRWLEAAPPPPGYEKF